MNRERASDLDPSVEIAPPSFTTELPSDDELDALCDQLMRIDVSSRRMHRGISTPEAWCHSAPCALVRFAPKYVSLCCRHEAGKRTLPSMREGPWGAFPRSVGGIEWSEWRVGRKAGRPPGALLEPSMTDMPNDLVLIPALFCDDGLYAEVLPQLSQHMRVHVIGAPRDTMAESVKAILDQAPETFVLAGTSYGAALAVEVALAAPDRVKGLWIMGNDPAGGDPEQGPGLVQGIEANTDGVIDMLAGVCGLCRSMRRLPQPSRRWQSASAATRRRNRRNLSRRGDRSKITPPRWRCLSWRSGAKTTRSRRSRRVRPL